MKNKWTIKKVGDVCLVKKGKKPVLFSSQKDNSLPYLGAKFMRGTKEAEFAMIDDRNSIVVNLEDLVIICDGSKSGDIFSGFHGVLSSTMGKLEINKEIILPEYLKLFLDLNYELFNGAKKGAAIPHLDFKVFYDLEIPLPPLEEQKRIVKVLEEKLGKVKEAIKLREEAIANTQKILPSRLTEIFEDLMSGSMSVKSIKDFSKVKTGGTPSKQNEAFWDGDIPWVSPKDMKVWKIGDAQDHVTAKAVSESTTNIIPVDSILIVVRSGILKHTLPISITTNEVTFNQDIKAIIPDSSVMNSYFLSYYLKSKESLILQEGIKKGVTVQSFEGKYLENFEVPVPDIQTQQKIVKELDELSTKITTLQTHQKTQLQNLKSLHQSYLHEAFNGELV